LRVQEQGAKENNGIYTGKRDRRVKKSAKLL
jgi:hypothetical protein